MRNKFFQIGNQAAAEFFLRKTNAHPEVLFYHCYFGNLVKTYSLRLKYKTYFHSLIKLKMLIDLVTIT